MGLFCSSLSPPSHRVRKDERAGVTRIDSLPDDIIIDILSRLPAECLLKHRRVCKRWLSLTSTSYFAQLHLKRPTNTTPLLLFQDWTLDLFQLGENNSSSSSRGSYDAAGIKKTKMKKMRGDLIGGCEHGFQIRASCDGLLVFQYVLHSSLRLFVVCNVVTRERVTVNPPVTSPSPYSSVHALFLHPVTKEYTMLYQNPAEHEATRYDFYLYSFTRKSWRQISSFHLMPAAAPAVLYNNRLHWVTSTRDCDSSIIVFDTITEKFNDMPHPGYRCSGQENHECLFMYEAAAETSSSLSLCLVKRQAIEIWVLVEYNDWCWTNRHVYDVHVSHVENLRYIKPLSVYKHELVFRLSQKLYTMNLHNRNQNAAIIVDDKGRMKDLIKENIERNDIMVTFLWTASFVSLNASKRTM